jgi:7 transmembrane receptor (rhodopsin family)
METIYPLFVTLYLLLTLIGTLSNLAMIVSLVRKSRRESLHGLMINLAFSDLVKCILVLPVSLAVLLIHNWVFGASFCYLLPMLQVGVHKSFKL